jgi:hypothetical protein
MGWIYIGPYQNSCTNINMRKIVTLGVVTKSSHKGYKTKELSVSACPNVQSLRMHRHHIQGAHHREGVVILLEDEIL